MFRTSRCSTPRYSNPRRRISQLNCLRSMRTLDYSIESSMAEDGQAHAMILTRRTVKRSLEKYFGFNLAHLTSLLVEFVHQQASIGVRAKDLTAYKDLLCIANDGNVSKDVLFILIQKIKHGPLARKWNLVLSTDLVNDAARFDDALRHGVEPHLIPSPYFDANEPMISSTTDVSTTEYDSLDLDQPSIVMEKIGSSRIPAVIINDEFGNPVEDPYVSLSYRKTPRRFDRSYNPAIFRNVIASTPERDINKKIDANWRERMKLPPKYLKSSYYADDSSYLEMSRVPYMSQRERHQVQMKGMTPRSLHKERMKDLLTEIHKINTYRPQYRYRFK